MTNENWRAVVGFEGFYEVSDLGNVRSMPRIVAGKNRWGAFDKQLKGKPVRGGRDKCGYPFVKLHKNGEATHFRVSRLVLAAFDRLPMPGEEARHGNHDPSDNRLANLSWGSRQDNEDDKTLSGRRPETTVYKLSPVDVTAIREKHKQGVSQKELAALFATHISNVNLIVRGKTWRHL